MSDKLEKVVAHATNELGGNLFFNGKAVDELEETVEHAGLHEDSQLIILMASDASFGEPNKWKRFKRMEQDYMCSSG